MNILIKNLSKRYGSQRAVNNLSFEIKTGEIVGFLGPNGAGKTTTMKMIAGYLPIPEGDIFIDGKSIKGLSTDIKRDIGYLQESNPLYVDMPVLEYLDFCASLQGVERKNIPDRIREIIKICGLNAEKHKKIGELSKGYRQRVGLAQALIHDPNVLVLDEPTTGLDPNQIVEIRKLIRKIGKEKTVILSTHILPEVEATCDRILIINKGSIVADGTPDTLRRQSSGQEVIRIKCEDAPASTIQNGIQNLTTVDQIKVIDEKNNYFEVQSKEGESSVRPIFALCVDQGWVLTEITPMTRGLEDIFRNVTLN